MSENRTDCSSFEAWLHDGAPDTESQSWTSHLEDCSACREQWVAHQMVVATFAEEAVPELSLGFEAGLQSKISAAIEVNPLRGWRLAAMAGYAAIAAVLLRWVFSRFPLPSIPIDPSSPWIMALAITAVPLSLWMTIGITRWLPSRRGISTTPFGLLL